MKKTSKKINFFMLSVLCFLLLLSGCESTESKIEAINQKITGINQQIKEIDDVIEACKKDKNALDNYNVGNILLTTAKWGMNNDEYFAGILYNENSSSSKIKATQDDMNESKKNLLSSLKKYNDKKAIKLVVDFFKSYDNFSKRCYDFKSWTPIGSGMFLEGPKLNYYNDPTNYEPLTEYAQKLIDEVDKRMNQLAKEMSGKTYDELKEEKKD